MPLVAGQCLEVAVADVRRHRRRAGDHQLDLAGDEVRRGGARALVGDVREVDAGGLVDHDAADMGDRAGAERGVVQLAGVGLRVGDEVLQVVDGDLLGDDDDLRSESAHGDAREILGCPVQVLDHRRIGGVERRILHQQRVAVGLGLRDQRGCDVAVTAALVVDDYLLAELLGEMFGEQAGHDVGAAARRRGDHQRDRPVGVGPLRQRGPAGDDGARCGRAQRQEVSPFHVASLAFSSCASTNIEGVRIESNANFWT